MSPCRGRDVRVRDDKGSDRLGFSCDLNSPRLYFRQGRRPNNRNSAQYQEKIMVVRNPIHSQCGLQSFDKTPLPPLNILQERLLIPGGRGATCYDEDTFSSLYPILDILRNTSDIVDLLSRLLTKPAKRYQVAQRARVMLGYGSRVVSFAAQQPLASRESTLANATVEMQGRGKNQHPWPGGLGDELMDES
ncbi:hypothetical protein Ddc_23521 [Ditylenchus destructor]|nr:hypothetical protein Ddc_23521 [Ditylenchus destructor]